MKIAYLAFARLPTEKAHGLQIMKTCEALARAGALVTLLAPDRKNPLSADPFAYYSVEPILTLRKLRAPDWVRFGRFGFVLSLVLFSEACVLQKEFWEADIVYSRDHLILLQYILLRRPLVFEAHQAPTWLSVFVAKRAKALIVISAALKDAYAARGVPAARITVAPDAIDPEMFSHPESKAVARARLGLSQNKAVALYIGRLDGWKGSETFLKASTIAPRLHFAVIGGEPDQIALCQKKFPAVEFLGYRPYSEVADNQSAADVLVLPNTARDLTSARFTSPLKLFTYMASQRPIVASDLPSIREVLDEESSYFVPADDPRALASMLAYAVEHPEESASKAERAKTLVKNFTWRSRAERILGALRAQTA